MRPKEMDSLDIVEAVMLIEEIFGTEIPTGMQSASAPQTTSWIGSNFIFPTDDQTSKPLLASGDWPTPITAQNSLRDWRAHGDATRLKLSCATSSAVRGLECNGLGFDS